MDQLVELPRIRIRRDLGGDNDKSSSNNVQAFLQKFGIRKSEDIKQLQAKHYQFLKEINNI